MLHRDLNDQSGLLPKKSLYLSVNVYSTKVLIGDRHFTWSSEPREGLALVQGEGSTFISQSFKDPECWFGPVNPACNLPLCSQVLY